MLNWFDYIIIAVIFFSIFLSLFRGFVREAVALLMWIIAFAVALQFANDLAPVFVNILLHPLLRFAASFIILLVATLLIGALINHLLGYCVKASGLSSFDRGLGAVFGLLRGVVIILVALFVIQMIYKSPPTWWQQSFLAPKIWQQAQPLKTFLPSNVQQKINIKN